MTDLESLRWTYTITYFNFRKSKVNMVWYCVNWTSTSIRNDSSSIYCFSPMCSALEFIQFLQFLVFAAQFVQFPVEPILPSVVLRDWFNFSDRFIGFLSNNGMFLWQVWICGYLLDWHKSREKILVLSSKVRVSTVVRPTNVCEVNWNHPWVTTS